MGKFKKKKKLIAGLALSTVLFGSVGAYAAKAAVPLIVGPKADGTSVTPHGWTITPAGSQLSLGDFPMGAALSPDQRYLVVSNDGQGKQSLQVVDLEQKKVVQTISYNAPQSLYLGVVFSPDGKKMYASAGGNNKIRTFNFDQGKLTEQAPIVMTDANHSNFFPAGLSISPDGKFLYVANNLNNSVSRIDISTGNLTTAPVGHDPYMPLLTHDGNTLFVSNWGESSISVLNANDLTVKATIPVGLHPNAMAQNPVSGLIYVANSDSDDISVIDPVSLKVTQTISLAPYHKALKGSVPNALTVSPDGKTLYVSNAGNDDIAVINLGDSDSKAEVKGLIPTAWYPTGVYLSKDANQLMVLNAKGLGAGPNTVKGQYIGNMIKGSMSFIDVPDKKQLKSYTEQVENNNNFNKKEDSNEGWFSQGTEDKANFPIPRSSEQSSPIKHVIYVVKENRTYDSVFGDLKRGNGDPSLTEFGQTITPNLHKLAQQFVTMDNFYVNSEISTDGHKWADTAQANDFIQKNWPQTDSGRRASVDILKPASQAEKGNIWNMAMKSNVSFRNYGEGQQFDASSGLWVPRDPQVGNNYDPNYAGYMSNVNDMDRYAAWKKEFDQFVQNGKLPQLEVLYLPNDHTFGTTPGQFTPQAAVSQNDYALGNIVDAVSHSPYWKDTAIFVTEDDASGGLDHVDGHRSEGLVISPYTQTGKVDSTFYDQMSMLRSMELILGLKPMTQFDASAIPMLNAFTSHPNFSPYTVEQPQYPIDKINGKSAPMAMESKSIDFSQPDIADEDLLNQIQWKATKGNKPFPANVKTNGNGDND
ncbi:40-residue YVTN family beta-propeller repeat-containing protein [Neobacillus massiliamazoniensis]|uniref:40-residue YVTN family beta-propeller repeat-containing protein n=1 Tax=Neobacillus massiliamazoniensis TaxID=1499688 RepID=A0A0U1NT47_9BACI|nr:40-residue YVTN family beta-propeller repeat-containing protein [Neobacillus massiliamazoniensis]